MEELVKQNRSASGMNCAKGGMGGMGGGGFSVGREQSSSNKISSFSCQINPGSFDEAAFVGSLKADVEQEINRSGATISFSLNADRAPQLKASVRFSGTYRSNMSDNSF
jgi:hypothetical protein